MAKENIKISKKLYSRSDVSNVLDLSFSELVQTDNRSSDVKIKSLFQQYNTLFYDIPKIGKLSHSTLFIQSRDYINDFYDPKDDQIEALLDRIETLEDEVLELSDEQLALDAEHPIFNNGSFLNINGNELPKFFMYQGKAHRLATSVFGVLSQKYQPGQEEDKFVVTLNKASELPQRGPDLDTISQLNDL